MDQKKRRLILIGITAVVIIVGFFIMSLYDANRKLSQDGADLLNNIKSMKNKNDALSAEYNKAQAKIRQLGDQLDKAQRDLSNIQDIAKDKEELQKKYEAAMKEKNELADRLSRARAQQAQATARPQVASVSPATNLGDDLYWAGVLKEKTNLEVSLSKVRDELKLIKAKFDAQQKENVQLESDLKSLRELDIKNLMNEKADLERRLSYSERTIDSLSLELVREKKDNRKMKEDYKAIESEKQGLISEMNSLRTQMADLNSQIKGLNDNKAALEDKLQNIESSKQDLEHKLMAINALLDEKTSEIMDMKQRLDTLKQDQGLIPKEKPKVYIAAPTPQQPAVVKDAPAKKPAPQASVELPPIVVKPSDASVSAKPQKEASGKVLEINTANKFVIVDIGEDAGLAAGSTLGVWRGSRRIATLEVIQTRKSICAADIKQSTQTIKVGDTVK
ncbi:MAG: hypothetical protein PHH69_05710 [Candidatus Omnitrophica bacterium]|nr:hypothetical protein [Candidatus Omnitrophota bacterium]MDD5611011.1 hypothetical protein [Candidatus Omnitrophota bacterium]